MKLFKIIFFIAILSLINCKKSPNEIVNIKVSDLQTLINTNKEIQLVDVRTPKECQKGTIHNALTIDVTASDFEEKALKTLDKSKPVYLYCRSGGRSVMAADILLKKGFKVYNLEEGYLKWQEELNKK